MKKFILATSLFLPLICLGQVNLKVQIGGNYPVSFSSNDLIRKAGAEIGVFIAKDLSKNVGIGSGFIVESFGRTNYLIENSNTENSNEPVQQKIYFLKNQLYIPFNGYIKGKKEKLTFNAALLLALRNIMTITNYSGIDPMVQGNDYSSGGSLIGLDGSIGIHYQFFERMGFAVNYRTPFTYNNQNYGVIVLGINYKITNQ